MKSQIAAALCLAVFGFVTSSSLAIAQQDNVRACLDWQSNKAKHRTNGVETRAHMTRCRAGAASTRRVYSSIKELMDSIIDPSADVLWGAVGTVVDQDGIHESFPKTPEEWLELRRAAVRIIEGGNLLMMRGREAAPAGTKSEVPGVELEPAQMTTLIKKKRRSFDAFAVALQALGGESLRAIDAKNAVVLLEIGGRMQDVCESCHKAFWYPNEKDPPARRSNAGSDK
jgi:hypothetical protein